MKLKHAISLFILFLGIQLNAQCTDGCDRTNPTAYFLTIGINETVCITEDKDFGSITFSYGSKLVVCDANISSLFGINGFTNIYLYGDSDLYSVGGITPGIIKTDDCINDGQVRTGIPARDLDLGDYGCSPLPIELISFAGEQIDNTIHLHWSTALEIDNDYFIVKSSEDLVNWSIVDTINGSGTIYSQVDYTMIDSTPEEGTNYYQLEQFDYDGQSSRSPIIDVEFEKKHAPFNMYPNPANEVLYFNLTETIEAISIYDNLGNRLIYVKGNEQSEIKIDISHMSEGTYFVHISYANDIVIEKLLIQR